ncbi:MAG TPA: glutamine--fructose-6-phosphate transaminase (isomerizing) [Candidatus Lambdaproteobacteria bacterium]|nr:glutamine--fructose-6-phosphate transaminase (isomerizing) [Candidatus Lambdaproteobacteria bacterium]
MCGISGIVDLEPIGTRLFTSIRNLEYRGYDSCGIATLHEGQINARKNIGGVDEVNSMEQLDQLPGTIGIAHTRWATHGGVTQENAHPHLSMRNEFAIAHNGIISNYQRLREQLVQQGFEFRSLTDSEVISNLLENAFYEEQDVEQALQSTLKKLEGTFGLVMISLHDPERIYAAKRESPLMVGLGEGTNYVGSDINAFLEYTRRAWVLEDGEYAVLGRERVIIRKFPSGKVVQKQVLQIEWDLETTKKGGYSHYMIKEIFDEPQTIRQVLKVPDEQIQKLADSLTVATQTYLIGVGTTFYVAQLGQYFFSSLASRFFPVVSSDEFHAVGQVQPGNAVLAVSQSGETYDTKHALAMAKERGAQTAGIVNVMGSSISMMVDQVIMQGSGPEICVVSTKTALAQALILLRTALLAGGKNIPEKRRNALHQSLLDFPDLVQRVLNEKSGFVRNLANATSHVDHWLYLGCGAYYPVAMESALKMKEVTYCHAEGMPAGFLKHGTLSMVEPRVHSLLFVPPPEDAVLHERTLVAMEEIRTRGGTVVGFYFEGDEASRPLLSHSVELPPTDPVLAPVLQMIVAQLFAYYVALALNRNIDKPRNLAKSVTVG